MNDDIVKMLSGMLQNPDTMKSLAGALGGNEKSEPEQSRGDDSLETGIKNVMSALNHTDDRRITLLNALRPYLSPQRASGVDRAIKILKLTKLSQIMRNEGE